jgi:molybdopterin-synthase adenylyltransferase
MCHGHTIAQRIQSRVTDPTSNPRYLRQLRLPFWDQSAQDRLANSHAMIVGCGALGCPSAELLARAGVGRLTLIDRDLVEVSNLHRQTLYTDADAKAQLPKAQAAKDRLESVNPEIEIHAIVADFGSYDAERYLIYEKLAKPDILIDGTDNFETRFLVNDLSVLHDIPYIYGGAIGTKGMAAVLIPGETPCLRCLLNAPPPPGSEPTCETAGVFAPVSAIVASYQASEALKLLIGARERVMGSMLEFDLWEGVRRRIELGPLKDPECPCCAKRRFEFLDREDEETVSICGRDAIQINPHARAPIEMAHLAQALSEQGTFETTAFMLKGRLSDEAVGLTVFRDGRAIFDGITDPALARSLYARYIGC